MDDLCMFYPVPIFLHCRIECEIVAQKMQDLAITAIADRMNIYLKTGLQHCAYFLCEKAIVLSRYANMSLSVAVFLQELCPTGTKRAVVITLHRMHEQFIVGS